VTDDFGNKVDVYCINRGIGFYATVFNDKYHIGKCPYESGINTWTARYLEDSNGSGKPDSLLGFKHTVSDGNDDDVGNWLWWGGFYAISGPDKMQWDFDVASNKLTVTQFTGSGSVYKQSTQCPPNIRGNQAPVPDAGPEQWHRDLDGNGFETITLDGSGSVDPDGFISRYEWSENGRVLGSGPVLDVNLSVGWHEVTLTVMDCALKEVSDTVIINVLPPPPAPQAVRLVQPYLEDFSLGVPGSLRGWESYSTHEGRIAVVDGRLRMDDRVRNSTYSQNWAILHLDLLNQSNVQLSGEHWNLYDEVHPGDGIAISDDGMTWHTVPGFDVTSTSPFRVDLDAAAAAAGIAYTSDFSIMFRQYDNHPASSDGREWDNIRVEIVPPPTAQPVRLGQPYVEDFSAGRPGSSRGWEYDSTNEGRIAVVDGRLRMDDLTGNSTYSQNEAILHLNLQGQSNVQLSGYHGNLADEVHPGDGIAISANGVTWHNVAAFNVSSTGPFVVNLDAAIAAAGINYTSDFRIKFQQYDNYPAPSDGREWDNIRVEVLTPPAPQLVRSGQPYVQDFSLGMPGRPQGWEYNSTNEGRIEVVAGRLRMDDHTGNSTYSQNEAILHLDLSNQSNVQLSGYHGNLTDEVHPGDGIAISENGVTWHNVAAFNVSSTGPFVVNLDAAIAAAGIHYTSDFRIKFQQYDNYPAPSDGREWDNIRVEVLTPPAPQLVRSGQPYVQDFSLGMPGRPQGWEYNSTNEGRIEVVAGRLRMDDHTGNSTYSQNEAILHLDLSNQSNVQLSGYHGNLADEVHPGDGIAISADGVTWHNVAAFNVSSTGPFAVNLDAAIAAAGIHYTADFQIKFQQYDNYPAPSDGREWDNIRVEVLTPPAPQLVRSGQPYVQDFSLGMPGRAQGWEYNSTHEGRIEVVAGRLRMDDHTGNSTYSQNEAILHLNLLGQSNVQLSGYHGNLADEVHPGDGIAISANGATWHNVAAFNVSSTGPFAVSLDAAIAAAGIHYTADFQIKFQQYDNYPAPSDGREWDDIKVELVPPQLVRAGQPYFQDFSNGMPGSSQGWEYRSTNEGRIAVVDGRLRMDDRVNNRTYSQNEAILHLDLLGQSNVRLSGYHGNLRDRADSGDGIAISADGVRWYRVAAFNRTFTGTFQVDLDAAIAAAGIIYASDFRIKFQQYGNAPAPTNGREWDDILVELL
jgi:hypothetical protein